MRPFHGQAGNRPKAHTPERPYGLPGHSTLANSTIELVYVSPNEFCRLERLGKRRKKRVTLAPVSITK